MKILKNKIYIIGALLFLYSGNYLYQEIRTEERNNTPDIYYNSNKCSNKLSNKCSNKCSGKKIIRNSNNKEFLKIINNKIKRI